MNTDMIPFTYEGSSVRLVTDDNGEPWFVASDIAKILGYREAYDMTRRLDADEKGPRSVRTPGGTQEMTTINEAGLYAAILGSKVEGARQFKRWVTHEVLPSIRRHGGYIDPRASEHQLNALIRQSQMQMELCQAAKGLIHPDHLEAKARIVLARGLGEHPQIDPGRRPLYVQDYLRGLNLSKDRLRRVAGTFGKAVKRAYVDLHGIEPGKYDLDLSNGQVRSVYAYTEADRPLMDRVWRERYALRAVETA